MIYWFIGFTGYETVGVYIIYWAVRNQYIRRLTFLEWIVVISSWPFILPKLRPVEAKAIRGVYKSTGGDRG